MAIVQVPGRVNFCWSLPAHSFLVSSTVGFHYQIFVDSNNVYESGNWTSSSTRGAVMALESYVANFKYFLENSRETLMNMAVTFNTTLSTRQRKNNRHCLLVIKQ